MMHRATAIALMVAVLAISSMVVAQRATLRERVVRPNPRVTQPAVPLVTIFKLDKTSVRGTVVGVDPDAVTIEPAAKPGSAENPAPVVVPWTEIRAVSSGLTQAKAVAQWKQANRDKLCETCRGERTVYCDTCKGTTHDPAAGKDCPTCEGELLVDCKTPRCAEGRIPCPNRCLKLTEGRWVTRDDGKRWRSFPTRNGVYSFSESHVGNLIQTQKDGSVQDVGQCPTCGGVTKIDCTSCQGLGQTPCGACTARKDAAACPGSCEAGRVKCNACNGSGLKGDQAA